MYNYRLALSFDGTDFYGSQKQPNFPTIQSEIEKSLSVIFKNKINVICCSRCDRGVHAQNFIINFSASLMIPVDSLKIALNTFLPDTILIKNVDLVDKDFHARFSAKEKIYEYVIMEDVNPFSNRYAVSARPLNIALMKIAASYLIGEHNFNAFTSIKDSNKTKVRTIYDIKIIHTAGTTKIKINASGFLYNMARLISQVLIEVGLAKFSAEKVQLMLSSQERDSKLIPAPAHGLFLVEVRY